MIYLKLFWAFFKIGLFSIGGGYAALPLIQAEIVQMNKWITMSEYSDLITISNMTPGPIAINSSTFIGTLVGGLKGAVVATIGCILPSCIIVSILAYLYGKYKNLSTVQEILSGLRPAIVSMIASAGISILILSFWGESGFSLNSSNLDVISIIMFAISLFILRKYKINPTYVMTGAGVIGIIIYYFLKI